MPTPSTMTKAEKADWQRRCDLAARHFSLPASDFEQLCRIERTLQQWNERECNGVIQRDENGTPRRYIADRYGSPTRKGPVIPDNEAGAIKRAKEIANRNGGWFYYQQDCRGCQVYFWRSADLLERTGGDGSRSIDELYATVGLACYF